MKTNWKDLAEFIDGTKEMAEHCQVTSDEMLALFIYLKNNVNLPI